MDDITIRELIPKDWESFRAIRLKALSMHAGNYGGTLSDAQSAPPEKWKDTLDGKGKRVFGLFDDKLLMGITGVFTWQEDPRGETGFMGMSYIEPHYRGRGLSAMLYQARIDFACDHHAWTKLIISHRIDNEASKQAIAKHGFQLVGEEDIEWPDGACALDCQYELDLEALRTKG